MFQQRGIGNGIGHFRRRLYFRRFSTEILLFFACPVIFLTARHGIRMAGRYPNRLRRRPTGSLVNSLAASRIPRDGSWKEKNKVRGQVNGTGVCNFCLEGGGARWLHPLYLSPYMPRHLHMSYNQINTTCSKD